MSHRRHLRFILPAVLAASLTLTACAAGGSSDSKGTESLTIASFEPDHLTPGRTQLAYLESQALFSPLTFVDVDGNVSMVAADSITSSDAVTWTITLKQNWTFHDGSIVTAQDYVDTWNAVAYGPNAWAGNGSMINIDGYEDLNSATGEPSSTTMSGLTVVDDTTFTVTLKAPDGQFPVQLSQNMPAFFPMPAAAFEDPEGYDRMPIGNGPFEMAQPWESNEPIVVTAYDDFAGETPGAASFTFQPYVDMGAAYTDAQAGNVDILTIPQDKAAVAEADFPGRLQTDDVPGITYLAFPTNDPRFADVRVRQAFSMAIDRDAVNQAAFAGQFAPATAWTSPAQPGTPAGVCGEYCEYDPDAAKTLLAEAGGFSGPVELFFIGGGGEQVEWDAYANQLRQNLGLDDVTASPNTDFAAFLTARSAEELTGPYYSGWIAPYPSQQATLHAVFTPAGLCAGCAQGVDPAVADAIAAADSQLDPAAAQQGYADAQALIAEGFSVAPLFSVTSTFFASEKVEDLIVSGGYLVLPQVRAAQ